MNNWLSDPTSTPNNNHAGFVSVPDNAMAYLQPPTTVNPQQFQNQPYLNGAARTSSPAFHNPVYQTNSVVPSKRPREDSLGTSPRQPPGGLPGSRSQTPLQGAYPGYNPQNGTPSPFPTTQTPYQHLQNTPNPNNTASPTIPQLNFNQGGPGQRVSTASPSPFSPHHGGPHMSPALSDHVSRGGTPHENPSNFMPNPPYGAGFNQQQFGQSVNGMPAQMPNNQMNVAQQRLQAQGLGDAQRNYQLQIQAQAQAQARHYQAQAAAASRANGMPNPNISAPNPQMAAVHQAARQMSKPTSPDDFVRGLQNYMAGKGRAVELNPIICGRQLPLLGIFSGVMKTGGSARVTKGSQWPLIASQLGFPQPQSGQAGQELQNYWMANIAPYESAWIGMQQKSQHMRMASQGSMQHPMQNQVSPTRNGAPVTEVNGHHHQRNEPNLSSMEMNGQMQNIQQPQPMSSSFVPPHQMKDLQEQQLASQHRASVSRQLDGQQANGIPPLMSTPSPQRKPGSTVTQTGPDADAHLPAKKPIEDPFKPEALPPSRMHGPINVEEMTILTDNILNIKPIAPRFHELGTVDVHALTMSIKSGIHAETRLALDTLVTLSLEQNLQFAIGNCDDLMETLIDCAQDQVDFLADHAAEVSDEMLLTSYEELVRGCRAESDSIQNISEFGTVEYDLDRAADRLLCITTLIRNFSFYETNFGVLGMTEVIRFLTSVIRYLGTKEMLLRNHRNTLDFMKDVIIYLTNLSYSLELPGKEEALCLLHFLLSFAPTPSPTSDKLDTVSFASYNPNIHKYMPAAVDSLAKLLARDEPNRTYYKSIFSADAHSTPPYELLTRAFGLAIAPLPLAAMHGKLTTLDARKPFILQGMLAAEILSGLAPNSDHALACTWLEADDGWAAALLRLVSMLSSDRNHQNLRHPAPPQHGRPPDPDPLAYGAIAKHGMAVLKTLVQKSRTVGDNGEVSLPLGVLPKKEYLLGAMIKVDTDAGILKQLCVYAALED